MDALIHKDLIQELANNPEPVVNSPATGANLISGNLAGKNRLGAVAASRTLLAAGVFLILALVLIAYLPILPGTFLMDDRRLIEGDNPIVNGQLSPFSVWFQTDFALSTFLFWAQWLAWGAHPGFYHAVNIALHAASALLLWRLLAQLRFPGAWLAGVIFAVHPVGVASVARIAELKNTLSLPIFLLSALFYVRFDDAASKSEPTVESGSRAADYALSLAAFVLALLAKTTTAVLPVLLLALAVFRRGRIGRRDLVYSSPFLALGLAFGLMSAWFQKHQALAGQTLAPQSFGERLALAGRAFWFYLEKAILPVNLNLVYPAWKVDASSLPSFLPIILFVTVVLVCWRFRNRGGKALLLGWLAFAVSLFPAFGFLDAQFLTRWQVSDHLQYLPLIAPVAVVAAGLATRLPAKAFPGVAASLILVLTLLTHQRAEAYSTPEKLFRDTLAKNPQAWAAHNDLGAALAAQTNYAAAEAEFKASLQANPDNNPDALANLAQIAAIEGKLAASESGFRAALKLKPFDAPTHRNFAMTLAQEGKPREAVAEFKAAVSLRPDPQTRLDLAGLYFQTGDPAAAADQFRQILRVKPDCVEALNNLAFFLATASDAKLRDGAEAVRLAERALVLPPVNGMCVRGTLAAAYAEAGRFPDAAATAEKAIREETAAGDSRSADLNRQLLVYYRAGQAWHGTSVRPARNFGIGDPHP